MLAAMPRGSSVGWLGCSRTESRPGRPIVLRNRVTTRHFARDQHQVLDAADLADRGRHFRRQARRQRASAVSVVASSDSSQSRKPPTVSEATGAKAALSWRIDDQPRDFVGLVRHDRLVEERRQRQGPPARTAPRRAPRRSPRRCPASWSPLRSGVALASSVLRSPKLYLREPIVAAYMSSCFLWRKL